MNTPTRSLAALAGLLLLTPMLSGCGQDATEQPATERSESTATVNPTSSDPEETTSEPPNESTTEPASAAADGWGKGEAPTADALAVMEVKDVAGGEGTVTVTIDSVEYISGVIPSKTVALVAMTIAAPEDGPAVQLAAPIDGGGLMYASTPAGTDAISTYIMMQDYSETWTGRGVGTFHSGPFNPGMPESVVQTLVIDEPGGALVFMQPDGHMAGPIELPADDAGLPNESITGIHNIMDTHFNSGLQQIVEPY